MARWRRLVYDVAVNGIAKVVLALAISMALAIWALLRKVEPVYVVFGALWTLVGILALINLILHLVDKQRKATTTQPQRGVEPQSQEQVPTPEEIAERRAFTRRLQAVADQLSKNSQGSYQASIFSLFRGLKGEHPLQVAIQNDVLITQCVRLLEYRLVGLSSKVRTYKTEADKSSPSTFTEDSISSLCNITRELVFEYRDMVDEVMKFLDGLEKRGVSAVWHSPPWSVRIHRELPDNYDELMRLVKDLRRDAPKGCQGLLPEDVQIANFPR